MKIIDCHSHIGKDYFWKNIGNIDEYIQNAKKLDINEAYIMSVPCPIINNNALLLHNNNLTNMEYIRVENISGAINYKNINKYENPYKEANDYIYEIGLINDLKINYVPIIHPYFYSYNDLISQKMRGARLLKIHGIACGIDPLKISDEFFKLLEEIDIPILIHTDFDEKENLLSLNSPFRWLKAVEKYNIKCYFAHGARLDKDVINIINQDNRYIIGFGPLSTIEDPNTPMVIKNEKYLDTLINLVDDNKLVFDLDYPWNINSLTDYRLNWNQLEKTLEINDESLKQKILNKNIERFMRR